VNMNRVTLSDPDGASSAQRRYRTPSNTKRSQTLTSVTQRSATSAKTKISMSPTLKMITDVFIDLERLFNG